MAIDFNVKDILHRVQVRFIHAFLPEAKKPYNLKAVHQPELDIHGIASKADVYNVQTNPKVIEEGLTAGMELIYYLVADGFRIKTLLPVWDLIHSSVRSWYAPALGMDTFQVQESVRSSIGNGTANDKDL